MPSRINIAKRIRKRRRSDGSIVEQPRYVVDFRDPNSHARRQHFFERRKDAEAKRAELIADMVTGRYATPRALRSRPRCRTGSMTAAPRSSA